MSNKINVLLSYPRSGNTWVRYFVEYVSKKPTAMMCIGKLSIPGLKKTQAIGDKLDIGVNPEDPAILLKRHHHDLEGENWNKDNSRFIFLIRNPKECVIRNTPKKTVQAVTERAKHFSRCINFYDQFDGDKILVYYEDLLVKPKENLIKIASFLGIRQNEFFVEFFENYDKHKANSIRTYEGKSQTGGSLNFTYHSRRTNKKLLDAVDRTVKEDCGPLYYKYLKRYE